MNGLGDARLTALQIVKGEDLEGVSSDKVFLVTGASSGIGIELGRAFAATGTKVFLAVRNIKKAEQACKSYLEPEKSDRLNVLVCNAGVMTIPTREVSEDGFEMQLSTDYLSHLTLFWLLKNVMVRSSTPDHQSRPVNVSSSGYQSSEIVCNDFNPGESYDPTVAYGRSKLVQIYHNNYVDRQFGAQGLNALSFMPGLIIDTNPKQYTPPKMVEAFEKHPVLSKWLERREQGTATTVLAATEKD